jgi:Secretion system C-terminal sorting domain/SprB repeat
MLRFLFTFIYCIAATTVFAQALSLSAPVTGPSRCSSTGSFQTLASGGTAPYSYRISGTTVGGASVNRPVQNTGQFNNLAGGTYTVVATDFSGATASVSGAVAAQYTLPSLPTITVLGTSVRVTPTGGREPYRYAYMGNADTTIWTNGHLQTSNFFPCLGITSLTFLTIDSCNNVFPVRNITTNRTPFQQANCNTNADGTTNITFDTTHYGPNYYYPNNGDASPYTFVCTNNNGVIITNQTGTFQNIAGCSFTVSYTDRCGYVYPTQQISCGYKNLCANTTCFNAQTGSATVVASGGVQPLTYSYTNPTTNITTSNTTGIFTGMKLNNNTYTIKTTDACGNYNNLNIYKNSTKNASARCPFDNIIQFSAYDAYKSISSYSFTGSNSRNCGQSDIAQYPIFVTLLNGTTVVSQKTLTSSLSGQFNIATFNPTYKVAFMDACGVADTVSISTTTTVSATFCTDPNAHTATITPVGGQPPYHFQFLGNLANTSGNTTGNYTGLPNQPYYIFRVYDACGSKDIYAFNYFYYSVEVYSKVINGVCKSVYALQIDRPNLNRRFTVQGGPNNTIVYNPSNSSFGFADLLPGTYYVTDSCMRDTIVLPEPQYNLSASVQTLCSGGAEVTTNGANTSLYYYNLVNTNTSFGGHASSYNFYNDTYTNSNSSGPINNTTNLFSFTTSGLYKMYLVPRGYIHYGQCPIDTLAIMVNAYKRPVLTAGYGVICPGLSTGDVCAEVASGAPPFTYILDPASIPPGYAGVTSVTTSSNSYCFPDLPTGSYDLRINDGCLINADYNASVGPYSFSPTYTRACNRPLQISLPNISGATYEWADSTSTTIGNTPVVSIADIGAATYTATVTMNAGCSYTHTLQIPSIPINAIPINAGADTTVWNPDPHFTIDLNGNPVPLGSSGYWQVLTENPKPSINDTRSNHPTLEVSEPGAYTFVWTINTNGCIVTDTITITFILGEPEPLPLKLLSFNAYYQPNTKTVKTAWQTASEENTAYFEVERSKNGYDFKKINNAIKAAGNSSTIRNYNDIDDNPLLGTSYYRLKMIDQDGSFGYSKIVVLNITNDGSAWLHYPNPTHGAITLETNTATTARLYNTQGQIIRTISIVAGNNTLDCSDLAAGVYHLKDMESGKNIKIVKY